MISKIASAAIIISLGGFSSSVAAAPVCTPLKVVGGVGTTVTKEVSAPAVPLPYGLKKSDNWNTDFEVTAPATTYVADITAINLGNYRISMYLKYPDNTSDKVFDQDVSLQNNQKYTIRGSKRTNMSPYQVNLFVGGIPVVGNSYSATVYGCR
jgi:hypothetical protein